MLYYIYGDCMNRLDNRGWGLGIFLIFIFIFLFAILLVTVLANKNGIGSNSESVFEDKNELIEKYKAYEKIVKQSAVTYQEENYPYLSDGDSFDVDINRLDIPSEINKKCTGYVHVEKIKDIYSYTPYLKCGNYYTTAGYDK